MHVRVWQRYRDIIVYDAELVEDPSPRLFDAEWWLAQGRVEGQFRGRGSVDVVRHGGARWVLRRYRRGGLVGRVADHSYVWAGLERSRPWREWHLLAELHRLGLPVPRPVAAHLHRTDLRYQGFLLSELIPDTQPLSALLQNEAMTPPQWQAVGALIRRFHAASVHHPDINASNILIHGDGRLFLIDFDKARLGANAVQLRADLQRLRRSFEKYRLRQQGFHFNSGSWRHLLSGYKAADQ